MPCRPFTSEGTGKGSMDGPLASGIQFGTNGRSEQRVSERHTSGMQTNDADRLGPDELPDVGSEIPAGSGHGHQVLAVVQRCHGEGVECFPRQRVQASGEAGLQPFPQRRQRRQSGQASSFMGREGQRKLEERQRIPHRDPEHLLRNLRVEVRTPRQEQTGGGLVEGTDHQTWKVRQLRY